MSCQQTLLRPVELSGIGLHRGQPARVRLRPAPVDAGIVFVREDVEGGVRIPARVQNVVDTRMCTTLSAPSGEARVQTVEHLLSALSGMCIDNCEVHVSGPEVPILDGSAAPFVEAIEAAGTSVGSAPARRATVRHAVEVQDGERTATLLPPRAGQTHLEVRCTLQFDHPLIPKDAFVYRHDAAGFRAQLASARTFGFLRDLESLRRQNLALGGTLDNALVFDALGVHSPGGLRFADECARHKILDALGDLSLMGLRLCGQLVLHCSGHGLHVALAQAVLAHLEGRAAALATA